MTSASAISFHEGVCVCPLHKHMCAVISAISNYDNWTQNYYIIVVPITQSELHRQGGAARLEGNPLNHQANYQLPPLTAVVGAAYSAMKHASYAALYNIYNKLNHLPTDHSQSQGEFSRLLLKLNLFHPSFLSQTCIPITSQPLISLLGNLR